jgi:molybdopterin-biosynthesis enzyme MoeA-like protein
MSGALNSIFGGGGILGAALNVASMCFPPMAIANALTNLLTQAIGQALTQAVQQLTQMAGLPKFIAQEVTDMLKQVLPGLMKETEPGCEQQVQDQCGGNFSDFATDFCKDIVNYAAQNMGGEKKKGTGSWYEALAQALGQALDKQAAKIQELSGQITDANAKDKPSTMTQLQSESQRMSFMMSAADQVIKTLGEALGTAARKG